MRFVKSGYKVFQNAQHLLVQLGRKERAFYDYLCEAMDNSNLVQIDKSLKDSFRTFCKSVTAGTFDVAESSLATYTNNLLKLGLLLDWGPGGQGLYIVNPKYVFKGSEKHREKYLGSLIAIRITSGRPVDKLLDISLDQFLTAT